jgi:beta-glucosidase
MNRQPKLFQLVTLLIALVAPFAFAQTRGQPDLTDDQWKFVDDLIAKMTIEEKAGQMVQLTLETVTGQISDADNKHALDPDKVRDVIVNAKVGSILNAANVAMTPDEWANVIETLQSSALNDTRLGIPLLYGIDSVHGANYITGATIFPHNLTLAATWNPELARRAGHITALESRAVGMNWNFSPVCDIARVPTWSRVFETFGEDPYLASRMVEANVEGMQGSDLTSPDTIAATAKHFLGYSVPHTGRDRTPAYISTPELYETFIPPFDAAFDAGARTIMINSGEINGVPVHADPTILRDLLRDELDYAGIAVTDWADVDKLFNYHRVAHDLREATELAVNAGIDMAMTPMSPEFADHVVALVKEGRIPESRIDESVRRILALKVEMGLFEDAVPDVSARSSIGSDDSAAASLQAAREGIVLLRNTDDVLPLKENSTILVTGPAADDLVPLHGSWTYSWQGTDPALYPDSPTIADALIERFGKTNVVYHEGATWDEPRDIDNVVRIAGMADAVVLCLGEFPSTEIPGDISDLTISKAQIELANALAETGTPVILVMVTNRARVITDLESGMDAILWAGHPGPMGPQALAEILAGDVNPSARLPFTYPRHPNALLMYDHKFTETNTPRDASAGYDPLFPFGAGQGYSTFTYSDLDIDLPEFDSTGLKGSVKVTTTITNTSDRAGAEVVQLYVTDQVASVTPRVKRLAAFDKVEIAPGESKAVTLEVPAKAFTMIDREGNRIFEPGTFTIQVANHTSAVTLRP